MRFKAYRVKSESHYQAVSLGILDQLYTSLVNCPKLEEDGNEYAVSYVFKNTNHLFWVHLCKHIIQY